MEQSITLAELLMLSAYLGGPVVVAGAILEAVVLRRRRAGALGTVLWVLITQAAAVALAVVFWMVWPFPFDVMPFGPIHLPALGAELIAVPVALAFNRLGAALRPPREP